MRFLIFCVALACAAQEPAGDIAPLLQVANASYLRGDYEPARQSLLKAWDLAQQTPQGDPARYDILKRLTSVRAAAGEFADADNYLQQAITWRENILGKTDLKVPADLLISMNLSRGMKDYDRALLILGRVMSMYVTAYTYESTMVADD